MGKRKRISSSNVTQKQKQSKETVASKPKHSTSRSQLKGTSSKSKMDKDASAPVEQNPVGMRTRRMAAIESSQVNDTNLNEPLEAATKPVIVPAGRESVRATGRESKKLTKQQDHPATKKGRKFRQEIGHTPPSSHNGTAAIAGSSKSKKVLSRAELIQLEAERIPSIKTSSWNPFTLFPKEVWELIFNNLTNPKDMENAINATPEWRQMYLPNRALLLFPQVVSVMAETEDEYGDYNGHYLLQDDYINCRLVCRAWDQAVQDYIQNHPVHYKLDFLADEDGMNGMNLSATFDHHYYQDLAWHSSEWMDFFVEDFAPTHPPTRNPFLCRQITLQDIEMMPPACCGGRGNGSRDLSQLWWSAATKLLEKYGNHVWHVILDYQWNLTPLSWYVQMQHWISLMPNLKVLDLRYTMGGTPIGERELTELANQIGISPIPSLDNLILLKTEGVPSPVLNELIQRAPNLQKLQIKLYGNGTDRRLCHYDLSPLSNHQLTEAYLPLMRPEDFTYFETSLPSWPLKRLYVDVDYEEGSWKTKAYPSWPNWDGVFGMVGDKFGSTLTELKLRLPKASSLKDKKRILSDNLQYRLNLPHLTELRVVVPNLSSFDFLLPLKSSLRKLILVVDHHEYEDGNRKKVINDLKKNESLNFTGNFATLFETNVFKELPKLENIQLFVSLKPKLPSGFRQDKFAIHKYDNHKTWTDYELTHF